MIQISYSFHNWRAVFKIWLHPVGQVGQFAVNGEMNRKHDLLTALSQRKNTHIHHTFVIHKQYQMSYCLRKHDFYSNLLLIFNVYSINIELVILFSHFTFIQGHKNNSCVTLYCICFICLKLVCRQHEGQFQCDYLCLEKGE